MGACTKEEAPILYWLLRALHKGPEEAKAGAASYRIGDASVTVVGFVFDAERQRPRSNGSATLSGSFGLTSPPRIVLSDGIWPSGGMPGARQ